MKLPIQKSKGPWKKGKKTKSGYISNIDIARKRSIYNNLVKQIEELGDNADEADSIGRDYARSDISNAINRLMNDNKIDKKYKSALLKIARDSASELEENMKGL